MPYMSHLQISQDTATATINKVLTVLLSRHIFESKSEAGACTECLIAV